MTLANVQRIGVDNVYTDIQAFFDEYESEKTKKEYLRDIQEFFRYIHGKELNDLTLNDITNVSNGQPMAKKHVISYRKHLMNKNSEGTVNRKITSIRSLYKFLQGEGYPLNYLIFALKALKYNPDSYGVLTKEQVESMAELALNETYGEQLHALIYLSAVTSIRITALLSLTWDNIKKDPNTRFYVVDTIDKRKMPVIMPFEPELNDKLVAIRKSEKLFEDLKVDYVKDAISKIAKELGIAERIVTHSLRKSAPAYEMRTTGNIKRGMRQTGHKSVQTFITTYTDKTVGFGELAGIKMFRKVDESAFENVSKEDILKKLKEMNRDVYDQLAIAFEDENKK